MKIFTLPTQCRVSRLQHVVPVFSHGAAEGPAAWRVDKFRLYRIFSFPVRGHDLFHDTLVTGTDGVCFTIQCVCVLPRIWVRPLPPRAASRLPGLPTPVVRRLRCFVPKQCPCGVSGRLRPGSGTYASKCPSNQSPITNHQSPITNHQWSNLVPVCTTDLGQGPGHTLKNVHTTNHQSPYCTPVDTL